jgi:hypothetical protein
MMHGTDAVSLNEADPSAWMRERQCVRGSTCVSECMRFRLPSHGGAG